MAINQKIDDQCTAVKRELYKLKETIEGLVHADDREQGLRLFERAYADIDIVQSFIKSR